MRLRSVVGFARLRNLKKSLRDLHTHLAAVSASNGTLLADIPTAGCVYPSQGNFVPPVRGPRPAPGFPGRKTYVHPKMYVNLPVYDRGPLHSARGTRKGNLPIHYATDYRSSSTVLGIPLFSRKYSPSEFLSGKYNSSPLLGNARAYPLYRNRVSINYAHRATEFEDSLRETLMDIWKNPSRYSKRLKNSLRRILFQYSPLYGLWKPKNHITRLKEYAVSNPPIFYWACHFLRKSRAGPLRVWTVRPTGDDIRLPCHGARM